MKCQTYFAFQYSISNIYYSLFFSLRYIDLPLPVFHIGFFRCVINILQSICKNPTCARILLTDEKAATFRAKLRNPALSYLVRKSLKKKILETTKKVGVCPHCGDINGVVKKCGLLKISHEKYRNRWVHWCTQVIKNGCIISWWFLLLRIFKKAHTNGARKTFGDIKALKRKLVLCYFCSNNAHIFRKINIMDIFFNFV